MRSPSISRAAYAKLKSQVASRTCHENGLMKRKLANLDSWRSALPSTAFAEKGDPLFVEDPWQAASSKLAAPRNCAASTSASTEAHLWVDWSPDTKQHDIGKEPASVSSDVDKGSSCPAAQCCPGQDYCSSDGDNANQRAVLVENAWQNWKGLSSLVLTDMSLAPLRAFSSHAEEDHIRSSSFVFKPSVGTWLLLPPTQESTKECCESSIVTGGERSNNATMEGVDSAIPDAKGIAALDTFEAVCESHEHDIIERLRAWKSHGWDPIKIEEVVEGAIVLADCVLLADDVDAPIEECARGVIIDCPPGLRCRVAFLNKGSSALTYATLNLPDERILHGIEGLSDYSDYSESDA